MSSGMVMGITCHNEAIRPSESPPVTTVTPRRDGRWRRGEDSGRIVIALEEDP
jgi:hypothetical protein